MTDTPATDAATGALPGEHAPTGIPGTPDPAAAATGPHIASAQGPVPVDQVGTYHRNPRRGNVAAIAASLERLGQYRPIVVNRGTATGRPNEVLAGNHTLLAARELGWDQVDAVWVDVDDDTAARIVAADNRTADLGTYDQGDLLALLSSLPDLDGTGYSDDDLRTLLGGIDPAGDGAGAGGAGGGGPSLVDRFLIPPFTVLDARQGYWRDRKQAWLSLGIQSEVGRGGDPSEDQDAAGRRGSKTRAVSAFEGHGTDPGFYAAKRKAEARLGREMSTAEFAESHYAPSVAGRTGGLTLQSWSGTDSDFYRKKQQVEAELGRELSTAEFTEDYYTPPEGGSSIATSGTSVFDPVLCELAYRWFSPPDGRVLDPFAGGSVRGIVAALLGRAYVGVELREEQVDANRVQAADIVTTGAAPEWHVGDSRQVLTADDSPVGDGFDLVFTCPPYADLERYSDDPADLSTMGYDDFAAAYREIVAAAVQRLADDRFAVVVVGEVRDKHGVYRGFVPDTIRAFEDAGARFYNEAVLVTPVGSVPVRAARQFESGRKLGKTHQNVLVFVKGDAKAATGACGPVEVADPAEAFGEVIE